MGEIYKGHAIQTGDLVAIKVIRADLAENQAAEALFRKEASILHNLLHEAIVRYYVVSKDPAIGRLYLAMEFVDGPSLSEVLEKGPLPYEAVRSLQRRLAAGLQAAHELGVVHRDMSPDNVILPGGDVKRAKIIDFGIARSANLGGATIIGGGFAGKYNYVSPEQLGLFGGEVTAKSDIYSMGLVLAEAFAGRAIDMGGSQAEIVEKRRRVPDLGGIDPRLRPLIERMLQPNPADRPDSMAEVAAWQPEGTALDSTAAPFLAAAREKPVERPAPQRSWLGPLAAAALLVAVGVGGAVAVYRLGLWPQSEEEIDVPPPEAADAAPPASEPPSAGQTGDTAATAPPTAPPESSADAGDTLAAAEPATEPRNGNPDGTTTPADSVAPREPPPSDSGGEKPAAAGPDDSGTVIAAGDAVQPASGDVGSTPIPAGGHQDGESGLADASPQSGAPADLGAPSQPGETVVAALPEVPPKPPETPAEKVTDYVRRYPGGPCFFAAPTVSEAAAVLKAKVEVFAALVPPVQAFDAAFRRDNGFEADIGLRQVTSSQCPVVDFLGRIGDNAELAPRLTMASLDVRAGEPLSGTVEGVAGRNVALLLVTDAGVVYDLSRYLTQTELGDRFDLQVEGASKTAAEPHLLLVLAADEPLDLPASRRAEEYFPRLLGETEAKHRRVGVAVKYFKLGG
jgi:serine/threonine-protein kinase